MDKIYFVYLYGVALCFFYSKRSAIEYGRGLLEPTHSDGEYDFCEFVIREWTEGLRSPSNTWEFSHKIGKSDD